MQGVNYSEQLKRRFAENGGKLFFTDGFKNRAFFAVREIFRAENPESVLCVVKTPETACQVNAALFASGREAQIICSAEDFKRLYHDISTDMQRAAELAPGFRNTYPRVIVTLLDEKGAPVLHEKLFRTVGKAGQYPNGTNRDYTVSDALADAGYAMLVIDGVYDMFAFVEPDEDNLADITPGKHERVDLMNKVYYTDIAHSYQRLLRLADSADKAIVISDCITDKDIVSFYAGASLVSSAFSYKAAKKLAKARSTSYDEELDRMLDAIAYSKTDETIQSLCLQRAKGRPQAVPGDLERLGKYSNGNLNFMTREDAFLRAFAVLAKGNSGMSNEQLLDQLEDDFTLARTVCDMFFDDVLKGDIESRIETSHIAKMSAEDFATFLEVFKKYGAYCGSGELGDKCKVYRIYHEDSGFEDLVRRNSEGFDRAENALCASYMGDDASYKSIAVKELTERGALKLPILLVTNSDTSEVVRSLSKITKIPVGVFDYNLRLLNSSSITVVDYDGYGAIANDVGAGSVVFFDVLSDMSLFDTYVKKALTLSDVADAAVLASYDNIAGAFIDAWQESWITNNSAFISVKNSEVYIRGEKPLDYNHVISELDEVYKLYKALIDGKERVKPKKISERFSNAVSSFTLGMVAHSREMEEDFEYFEKIAPYYAGSFTNSVSVGNQGMEVFAQKRTELAKGKRKKVIEYLPVEEEKRVAFNICAKQFHGSCDCKSHDCSRCPIVKNTVNNIEIFSDSVKGYFKETVRIMTKLADERIERQLDDTIGSQSSSADKADIVDIAQVRELSDEVNKLLRSLLLTKPNAAIPFYGKYSDVFDIREAMQSIHYGIFKKYYAQLVSIFEKATGEMKKSFDALGQGAKSSLQTL